MNHAFAAEFRRVEDREREGEPVRVVVASRHYETDRDDLWNALTDVERLPRWFAPISGELKLGGRYQVEGNAGGTILRCEAPDHFEITWEYGGQVSWVVIRLDEEQGKTRLTLEHSIPKTEQAEEHWQQYGPGATGVGWDLGFVGLGEHLASGETVDREAAFAWMGSEDGKAFMRKSSAAWGQAHLESGESKEVVDAIAERTAAFYTGG